MSHFILCRNFGFPVHSVRVREVFMGSILSRGLWVEGIIHLFLHECAEFRIKHRFHRSRWKTLFNESGAGLNLGLLEHWATVVVTYSLFYWLFLSQRVRLGESFVKMYSLAYSSIFFWSLEPKKWPKTSSLNPSDFWDKNWTIEILFFFFKNSPRLVSAKFISFDFFYRVKKRDPMAPNCPRLTVITITSTSKVNGTYPPKYRTVWVDSVDHKGHTSFNKWNLENKMVFHTRTFPQLQNKATHTWFCKRFEKPLIICITIDVYLVLRGFNRPVAGICEQSSRKDDPRTPVWSILSAWLLTFDFRK